MSTLTPDLDEPVTLKLAPILVWPVFEESDTELDRSLELKVIELGGIKLELPELADDAPPPFAGAGCCDPAGWLFID